MSLPAHTETCRRVYSDDSEYKNAYIDISPEDMVGKTLTISTLDNDESIDYWGKINFTLSFEVAQALAYALLAEIADNKTC